MEPAIGLVALGTSVLLGGLTLLASATGLAAAMAVVMAHGGLVCVAVGTHLLRPCSSAPVRVAYSALCGLLFFCVTGIDIAILFEL